MKSFNAQRITEWNKLNEPINKTPLRYSKGFTDQKLTALAENLSITQEIKLHSLFTSEIATSRQTHWGVRSYQDYLSSYQHLYKKIELLIERKVAERTHEVKEANEELDSFAYSVSHDLRAPLQVIKSYSSILTNKYSNTLDDTAKNLLDGINTYSKSMSLIMDNLLNLSRLGKTIPSKKEVNMQKLVEQVITELAPVGGNSHATISFDNLGIAYCDAGLIKQVWINLVSNALKYSGKASHAKIEIGCTQENGKPVYFIQDNGVGFNMKYADKLFGLFNRLHDRTEFEGTGVGLNIAYRIITKHGGKIWALAKENEGATFYFTLP